MTWIYYKQPVIRQWNCWITTLTLKNREIIHLKNTFPPAQRADKVGAVYRNAFIANIFLSSTNMKSYPRVFKIAAVLLIIFLLITGLITERGICKANEEGISSLFPEKRGQKDK